MASTVGILGAGTMGEGIAQVACTHGWNVVLLDVDAARLETAVASIEKRLARLVEKGKMTEAGAAAARSRLRPGDDAGLADAELLIEAIVEDLDVKTAAVRALLPRLPDDVVLATNTSSLSVSRLGEAVGRPARVVGMHFFNPAPLLKLVEVIAGTGTDPDVVDRAATIATDWGKVVARARDVPGFIVNHVARPYYLEAFRILEEGHASVDRIDHAMTTLGGFRMGPFALTDLIGQDVNAATTRSVWEQLDNPPLLKPNALQESLVAEGHLGRKTGQGVYDYAADPPTPAVPPGNPPPTRSGTLTSAANDFAGKASDVAGGDLDRYIFARILAALIVQAAHARDRGVAEPADIDVALRCGVNYPRGPFEWSAAIGVDTCHRLLERLNAQVDDDRFAPVMIPA